MLPLSYVAIYLLLQLLQGTFSQWASRKDKKLNLILVEIEIYI